MTTDAVGAAPGSRWFRVACWLWIATGIGHTVGNHTSLGPRPTAEELALRAAMQEVRLVRPTLVASTMGLLTALYGIGQIVGPPVVAWILRGSASTGAGFTLALEVAAATLVLGAAIFAAMCRLWPKPRAPRAAAV